MRSDLVSPFITLENVTAVRPSGEVAVRNFTWTISEGETWAIVGPVGAGKTSLAEVLTGRHRITFGKIGWPLLHRITNCSWPSEAIRLVSFREQSHLFSPAKHYYQQRFNFIEPQDDLTLEHYLRAGTDREPAEVAARLGLSELLPLSFIALSSGQMRRARIARALLARPEMLILDDPFLGLDMTGRAEVADMLGDLVGQGSRLIIICRREAIPDWATHVLELPNSSFPGSDWERTAYKALPGSDSARGGASHTSRCQAEPANQGAKGNAIIELKNVTVAYGGRAALKDLSWAVRRGERWAVVGPNGSGKTTLLSLLCGDHPQAYANDVRLFGRRRGSGESIWEVKRSVGLVSSELHQYYAESLTAADAAATGFHDVLAYRRPTAGQAAGVRELFEQLAIHNLLGRRFDRLSTGEQSLVLLIRALVKRPPLLILDEPFQGLDTVTMARSRDWLDRHLRPEQTLIIVTHDESEIPRTVTRRLELENGSAVAGRRAASR